MLKDPQARILSKRTWPGYVLLTISSPRIAAQAQPGQFLMIRVHDGLQPLLRRPFSIHAAAADTVTVFFQTVGPGTALLAEKPEGEGLDIIGPLGKGFGIRSNLNSAVLVGGGRGIAPLFSARSLRARKTAASGFFTAAEARRTFP